MLYEERVEGDPVPAINNLAQALLGLLGCPGAHDPETVRDAVDVRVDGDRRDAVPEHEDAVRGLRPDAPQGGQLLERPGDLPVESALDVARDLADDARLDAIEPRPMDETFHGREGRAPERRGVGVPGEQLGGGDVRRLVSGPLAEDGSDQDLERVLRMVPQIRDAPVSAAVERRQAIHHEVPIDRPDRGHPFRPRVTGRAVGSPSEGGGPRPGSERSGSSAGAPPSRARRRSPTR